MDKSAIIKNAQKLSAKGQIDGAIAEWEKLLQNGRDATIHNSIGDLYLRKGSQDQAIEAFVKAAEIFREDGFIPKSIAIFKKILNAIPSEVHALTALAELNEEKGLFSNAAEHYRKAAETYFRNNELQSAIDIFERIVKIIPSDMVAKVKIAELHVKMGLNEVAGNDYSAVAAEYYDNNDNERANVFYNKALETNPENAAAFLGLCRLEEDAGNIQKARELILKAMESAPGNDTVIERFTIISQKAGSVDEAKNVLTKLITDSPDNLRAKKALGSILLDENETQKAWDYLSPCIEECAKEQKYPEAIDILNHFRDVYPIEVRKRVIEIQRAQGDNDALSSALKDLAAFHEESGNLSEALELFREAQALAPKDTAIFESINDLEQALSINVPGEAAREEEVAPSIDESTKEEQLENLVPAPDSAHEYSVDADEQPETLAQAPDSSGEYNVGVDEPIETEAQDYEHFYSNGVELKEKGRFDEAIQEFQKASQDPSKALLSTRMIAACLMQQGAYTRAIAEFNKILAELTPSDAGYSNTKYELADAHFRNRDHNKAIELFSEIKSIEPGFRDVDQKIEEIKSQQEPTQPAKAKPRKERISYI